MYVGIIDQDLLQRKRFRPNLETMQISTYHKQKKDIVELVIVSKNIEKYDKLYLIKNKNDKNFLPKVIADPRTTCIGLGFTNGEFVPHPEFDTLQADPSIYDKYMRLNYAKMSKANQQRFRLLKKTDHFRINLGNGKFNWVRPQNRKARIYDLNPLEIDGLYEFCNQYQTVRFVHKCYVDTFEDIIKWLSPKWFLVDNELYYTGEFTDKKFKEFANIFQNHKKAPHFIIDYTKFDKSLQEEFALWLNRSLYALTRDCHIRIYIPYECPNKFYNMMFNKIQDWNNYRYCGKSFKQIAYTKFTRKEFDKLLERDYNISRMVQIIPNQYKKESNWNYVN